MFTFMKVTGFHPSVWDELLQEVNSQDVTDLTGGLLTEQKVWPKRMVAVP